MSAGEIVSAAQDAKIMQHWLNYWSLKVGTKPLEAVSDYFRAFLAAESMAFNQLSFKDVAHFIAILCRLKCSNANNRVVKDFLIHCIALLVFCDDFKRFEDILLLTLTISTHEYNGSILGSSKPSFAEEARLKLLDYICSEEHNAIRLVSDEENNEFKNILTKLSTCRLDPRDNEFFLNEEPHLDVIIDEWFAEIKSKADKDKHTKDKASNQIRIT